jgi:Leucine-rich repeat (LRR) protein
MPLKTLKLENTEVTTLPDYLSELPALELIEISGSNVKTIPPSLQRLADSGKLNIRK